MKRYSSKSLMGAAMRLFPEIGLEETKFPKVRRMYEQTDKNTPNKYTIKEDIGKILRTSATFSPGLHKGIILIHL